MNHAIFDSNILIDYLSGNLDALSAIDASDHPATSKIVYMEVMVGCKHAAMVHMATPEDYDDALPVVKILGSSSPTYNSRDRVDCWTCVHPAR